MGKILLYVDEDSIDENFVQALRSHNVDVLTVANDFSTATAIQNWRTTAWSFATESIPSQPKKWLDK